MDKLVIEGWMMGYIPNNLSAFENINNQLKEYQIIWDLIDHWIFIETETLEVIYEWRWQQEIERNQGMTKKEIFAFVDSFMTIYKNFKHLENSESLVIKVDKNRKIIK